jgi:hypothetical protein
MTRELRQPALESTGASTPLRLDDDQRAYLYELGGKERAYAPVDDDPTVHPQVKRLLNYLTNIPAMVQACRLERRKRYARVRCATKACTRAD